MEGLESSLAEGEAFIEAESNTRKPHPNENCLNCGTKLVGNFCHQCGQKDIPRRQVIGDLVSNFIEAFTNFDGKFLKTTKYLFLKPGFLPVEYNNGKRETYFHPVRMYTFASFLFFILFVALPDSSETVDTGLSKEDKEELSKIGLDSTLRYSDSLYRANEKQGTTWSLSTDDKMTLEQYDSVQNSLPREKRDGWWERLIKRRSIELTKKYKDDNKKLGEAFLGIISDNFSTALFFLMPFFALVLKLLYVRRDYFYAEHLSFTIYYYNFFYLAGSLMMIFNIIPFLEGFSVFIGCWIYFYLLFAMKRMYGQGWTKTILKFGIFTFLFSILMTFGIIFLVLFALMSV